jgi:hypothetical protein
MRVIPLLARPTRLTAIAFDFPLSTGITGFWFPLLALETEYSVDFVVADAHIAERPRARSECQNFNYGGLQALEIE